ncbi:MAG: FAD-binding oxidoreductase [Anaerolineae bacterium]|nr:FAD-binding oxidoreductase [Anaerolineae bacterium]
MADYIIVGGGIYGCAVAWELAKRGADVQLLEAKTIASGASGGLGERGVRANGRDLRELPLMRLAYDIWPTLHEQIGGFTGYRRLGHLQLIEREEDLARAPAQVWLQNQQGVESRLLDAAQTRGLEPQLSEDVIAAIYCPNDGVADHSATTRSMAKAARAQGAVIQENARVTGMARRGERVVSLSVEIDGSPVDVPVGERIILLSNAHVGAFVAEYLGLELPIWRMLPQVMALRADIPPPMRRLIGHAHRTLAIKPLPDGRVMVSGGWRGRWDETTGRGQPVAEQVEGNRLEAVAVYPALADLAVDEVYTDRAEMVSIDGIPIIDALPGADNMLVGVGWSGHGWAIAPTVARLLAEWALSGRRPGLLAPFGYGRFFDRPQRRREHRENPRSR